MKVIFPECSTNEELVFPLKVFNQSYIPAGTLITDRGGNGLFQILDLRWRQLPDSSCEEACVILLPLNSISAGEKEISLVKRGWSIACVTLSDKGAAGLRIDKSGPLILEILEQKLELGLKRRFLLSDESGPLKALLSHLALAACYDLIITTGGTGVGPRDNAPQVTNSLLDLPLPGITQAMMAASLAKTPNAVISRASSGLIGRSLIINLPGSVKAVRENLNAVLPALSHCLAKIHGDSTDCGTEK